MICKEIVKQDQSKLFADAILQASLGEHCLDQLQLRRPYINNDCFGCLGIHRIGDEITKLINLVPIQLTAFD